LLVVFWLSPWLLQALSDYFECISCTPSLGWDLQDLLPPNIAILSQQNSSWDTSISSSFHPSCMFSIFSNTSLFEPS
jgi:hypothetical protein